MREMRLGGVVLAVVLLAGCVTVPAVDTPATKPLAYLEGHEPDIAGLIGPPPAAGSGALAGDLATFKATRSLEGGARWKLAAQDAAYGAAPLLQDFSCAVGVRLSPERTPRLLTLLARVAADADLAGRAAKQTYGRPRPFVEHGGPICVADEPWLRKSPSYPSGHSTYGWTAGLILASLAPDKSVPIVARARVYGESRVACGVHYPSDVDAGRTAASALYGQLATSPAYRRDLEAARVELAKLRRVLGDQAVEPQQCDAVDDAARIAVR